MQSPHLLVFLGLSVTLSLHWRSQAAEPHMNQDLQSHLKPRRATQKSRRAWSILTGQMYTKSQLGFQWRFKSLFIKSIILIQRNLSVMDLSSWRGDSWVLWLLAPARSALLDDVLGTVLRSILNAGSGAGGEDRQVTHSRQGCPHSTDLSNKHTILCYCWLKEIGQ